MRLRLEERHIRIGVTAFLVIVCSIIVFFAILRFDGVCRYFDAILSALEPFILGLIIAYLLCPIYNATVRNVYAAFDRRNRKFKRALTISKAVGTVVSIAAMLIVVTGVLWMILPGLIESIINIIEILPGSMAQLLEWVNIKLAKYPEAITLIDSVINSFTENAVSFVTETLVPEYTSVAVSISEGVIGVLNIIKNLFIAVIVCAYFLNIKDTFAAQIKKVIIACFKPESAEEILHGADFVNKTFGGFISGKIIDSAIVGCICFVFMSIFGWEYTLLISCIIGITNIIPFFGPFIGAIPSALLLLMVDVHQCLWFLVFVLILQQFDGNILGPKILGETTGIASFWVLFSVVVGGSLFGFIGMVVGIPIFVVIYAYFARTINKRLQKKGFSTVSDDYRIDKYRVKPEKKKNKFSIKRQDRRLNNGLK